MTMRFWTIQPWHVVETVMHEGLYQPDFAKSAYLRRLAEGGNPRMADLYRMVLEGFAAKNGVSLPGVVFAFTAANDEGRICDIMSKRGFDAFMRDRDAAVHSLMRELREQPGATLLELEYPDNLFSPMLLDINDFQAVMPPVMPMPPYDEQTLRYIIGNIRSGESFVSGVLFSGVMQAHLPFIDRRSLIGIYPIQGGRTE